MAYHVVRNDGVVFETSCPKVAKTIHRAVKEAVITEGSQSELREIALSKWGNAWLKGPTDMAVRRQ